MTETSSESKELKVLKPESLTKPYDIVKKGVRKYLDKEEVNAIINNIPAGKDKMLLTTMWMTGLRVTEIISLRKHDINWDDNTLRVRWLKSRRYYERIIAIKQELKQLLQFYTMNLKAEDMIFPYSRQRVYQICKKYDKNVHPHTFRHSFAVNFLRQTKDVVTLSRLLGHNDLKTTMEYLKIVPIDQAKELEKVTFT